MGQEAAGGMTIRSLITQSVGVGLLLLTGCEASRNMRDDLLRLTSSQPTAQKSQSAKSVTSTRPRTTPPASTTDAAAVAATVATSDEPPALPAATSSPALSLIGKSETELRAVLGAPTSEEDRPPGKLWRYRDGQCTLVVQLYPDVHTKQFGTLGYEVKSDDNTDRRKACLFGPAPIPRLGPPLVPTTARPHALVEKLLRSNAPNGRLADPA